MSVSPTGITFDILTQIEQSKAATAEFESHLRDATARINELKIEIPVEFGDIDARLKEATDQLAHAESMQVEIPVGLNTDDITAKITEASDELARAQGMGVEIPVDIAVDDVQAKIDEVSAALKDAQATLEIPVDFNADEVAVRLEKIDSDIQAIEEEKVRIEAEFDDAEAQQGIKVLDAAIKELNAQKVEIEAAIDQADLAFANSEIERLSAKIEEGGIDFDDSQIRDEITRLEAMKVKIEAKLNLDATAIDELESAPVVMPEIDTTKASSDFDEWISKQREYIKSLPDPDVDFEPVKKGAKDSADEVSGLEKLLDKIGNAQSPEQLAQGFIKSTTAIAGAVTVAKALTAALEGINFAIDFQRHKATGDLEAELQDQAKISSTLRSLPVVGPLGGIISDLAQNLDGSKAALEATNREIAAQEKLNQKLEMRANLMGKAVQQAEKLAQAAEDAAELRGVGDSEAELIKVQQQRQQFREDMQKQMQDMGRVGRVEDFQPFIEGDAALAKQEEAAQEKHLRAMEQARVTHQQRMSEIIASGRQAILQASGQTLQAEREALDAELHRQVEDAMKAVADAQQAIRDSGGTGSQEQVQRVNQASEELRAIRETAGERRRAFEENKAAEQKQQSEDLAFEKSQAELRMKGEEFRARQREIAEPFQKQLRELDVNAPDAEQRKNEIVAARDAALAESEGEHKKDIAQSVADFEAQARESSLRAAGRDYEADTAAYEEMWRQKIEAAEAGAEKEAALKAKAAADTERQAARGVQAEDIEFRTEQLRLETAGKGAEAELRAIQRELEQDLEAAGGDKRLEKAELEEAAAQTEAMLKHTEDRGEFEVVSGSRTDLTASLSGVDDSEEKTTKAVEKGNEFLELIYKRLEKFVAKAG